MGLPKNCFSGFTNLECSIALGFEPDMGSQGGESSGAKEIANPMHYLSPVSQSLGHKHHVNELRTLTLRLLSTIAAEHRFDVRVIGVVGGDGAARLLAEYCDELVWLLHDLTENRML